MSMDLSKHCHTLDFTSLREVTNRSQSVNIQLTCQRKHVILTSAYEPFARRIYRSAFFRNRHKLIRFTHGHLYWLYINYILVWRLLSGYIARKIHGIPQTSNDKSKWK